MAVFLGNSEPTPLRQRLENAFEHFVDAREASDVQIASMLREHEIDIAIDLMGPTEGARPGIFSHRPAPIQQLSWLRWQQRRILYGLYNRRSNHHSGD